MCSRCHDVLDYAKRATAVGEVGNDSEHARRRDGGVYRCNDHRHIRIVQHQTENALRLRLRQEGIVGTQLTVERKQARQIAAIGDADLRMTHVGPNSSLKLSLTRSAWSLR